MWSSALPGLPGHAPVPGPDNHTTARALGQRPRRLAEVLAHQAAGLPAAAQPEGRYDLVGAGRMAGEHRAATLARGVAQRLAQAAFAADPRRGLGPLAEYLAGQLLGQTVDVEAFQQRQRAGRLVLVGP